MFTTHVPLSVIIWDFDGVLNDNAPMGRYLWADDFEQTFDRAIDTFTDTVFGTHLPDLLTGETRVTDRAAAWIEETGANTTPNAVVEHWLSRDFHPSEKLLNLSYQAAKRGATQVILTNADHDRADWVEQRMDAFPHVSHLFASARLGVAKPDPAAFTAVSDALGVRPGACLMVDDDADNVNAAAGCGMRTFRYSRLAHDVLARTVTTERMAPLEDPVVSLR